MLSRTSESNPESNCCISCSIRNTSSVAITKSSWSPNLAAYPVPDATNDFNSLINDLLAICIRLVSIRLFSLAQAANLLLLVVVNPLRYLVPVPPLRGSVKNVPGMFSSPIWLITTKAASPRVLFSML